MGNKVCFLRSCIPVARQGHPIRGLRACGRTFERFSCYLMQQLGRSRGQLSRTKTVDRRQTIRMREYPSRIRRLVPAHPHQSHSSRSNSTRHSALHTRSYRDRSGQVNVATASRCVQPTSSIRATGNRPRGQCNRISVCWALNTCYRLRRSAWRDDSSSTLLPGGQGRR